MRQGFNFLVPEGDYPMPGGCRLTLLMSRLGVLKCLSRLFVPGQVVLLPVLLYGGAVGVRGRVVQFSRPLVVLIMRSVVITSGHI